MNKENESNSFAFAVASNPEASTHPCGRPFQSVAVFQWANSALPFLQGWHDTQSNWREEAAGLWIHSQPGERIAFVWFFFSFHNLGKNDSQPSQKLTVRSGRLPRWSCITRGSFRCIHLRSTARLWVFFSGSNFLLSWRKYQKNVVAHPMLAYQEVAATCLFLGSKVEEVRVPLRDCVMVTLYERSNRQKKFHETTEVFFKILFYLFSLVLFTKRLPCSGIQGPSQENSGARDDSPAHALLRPCRWAPLWLNP